jgi:hypothetical protein
VFPQRHRHRRAWRTLTPSGRLRLVKPKSKPDNGGVSLREPKKEWASLVAEDDFLIRGGFWTPPPQDRQALLVAQ